MRRVLIVTVMAAALCFGATMALAQSQPNAAIALHTTTHLIKGDPGCAGAPDFECSQYNKTWPVGASANLYLNVVRGNAPGIGGLSCGIEYDQALASGVDVYSWTLCASGLEFVNDGGNGDWPNSLGGNRMTWNATSDCQLTEYGTDGIHATAGFFYVYAYSADVFMITPNNNLSSGPELQVVDCLNATSDVNPLLAGKMGFGVDGLNPCTDVTPVAPATWGQIKNQY